MMSLPIDDLLEASVYIFFFKFDASTKTKIKSADFTSGHQFKLGTPISVACKDDYNTIAYITKLYWIYCIWFYMSGDADYKIYNDISCIVYYI